MIFGIFAKTWHYPSEKNVHVCVCVHADTNLENRTNYFSNFLVSVYLPLLSFQHLPLTFSGVQRPLLFHTFSRTTYIYLSFSKN